MIPSGLYDPKRAEDLKWYLIEEIRRTMGDRQGLEADWIKYEEYYRARPVEAEKLFPFKGAANLVIPVMATDVDTLFARLMGILYEPQNLWSVKANMPEFKELAPAVEEFLTWAQHQELDTFGPIGDWILEMHKLGTGILKQRYTREMKKVYEWREFENGQTWQQQAVILLKDKPAIHHVRLHDFYVPAGFKELSQAPWCAERVRLTWQQFMNRTRAGIYQNAQTVGAWFHDPMINSVQSKLDRISNYRSSRNKQLELFEFWLDYDIDGDGWDESLVCTVHLDSQSYQRLDFNPFFNQEKPYTAGRFTRDVNSFYGIGMGEMLCGFQEEITAMHNQRLDNGTIHNSTMLAIRKDETGIKNDQPFWPGKQFRVNNIDAIKAINLGSGHAAPESIQNEAITRSEGQRRVGVNDYVEAQAGPSTAYGSAYTTQQMILASSKRFGETLREIRRALSETGTRVLEMYQQYNPRGKQFVAVGVEDGMLVDMVLKFPLDLIRKGLTVGVTAIDSETSKDARIRTTTLVMQQLMQYYQGYMQAMSYAVNPQLPPQMRDAAMKMATSSTTLMSQLLTLYGEQDADAMLPVIEGANNVQQQQLAGLFQLVGGGTGGPGRPPQTSGMGALPGIAQGPAGLLGTGMPPLSLGSAANLQGPGRT